jgi:transcriptional regulator with XRE-family HTH domain
MLGFSQSGLAKALGISSKQISNLETGARPVQQQTELAIECLLRRAGKWQEFNESN